MKNVLEIKNVSKKIGKKLILDDITFDVKEGEVFGFVGPNGAGKTTLIKTMLGLYKQDSGFISIGGYDLNKNFEKAMEQIGAIIENPEMYSYLSGMDNLNIYSIMSGFNDLEYKNKVINTVKLENRINNKVKTYSLGMRQRLGIAQALISKPKLLILDEPTNGLDPIGIKELRDLLKRISKENNIVVFVSSHILSEIELMCDRIAIIDNGSIVEIKDMNSSDDNKQLKVSFEVSDVDGVSKLLKDKKYKTSISSNCVVIDVLKDDIPVVNKFLVESGFSVFGINAVKRTLEDEFIEKTKGTKGQIR